MPETRKIHSLALRLWGNQTDSTQAMRNTVQRFTFIVTTDIPIYFFPRMLNCNFRFYYSVLQWFIVDYLSIVDNRTFFFFKLFNVIFTTSLRLFQNFYCLFFFATLLLILLLFLLFWFRLTIDDLTIYEFLHLNFYLRQHFCSFLILCQMSTHFW
jgi:hypothetical protein